MGLLRFGRQRVGVMAMRRYAPLCAVGKVLIGFRFLAKENGYGWGEGMKNIVTTMSYSSLAGSSDFDLVLIATSKSNDISTKNGAQ